MSATFKPGDLIQAPDPDHPGHHIAGVFAGMSNASGRLRVMVETGPRGFVWCDADTAVVLPPVSESFAAKSRGGSASESEPR